MVPTWAAVVPVVLLFLGVGWHVFRLREKDRLLWQMIDLARRSTALTERAMGIAPRIVRVVRSPSRPGRRT